MPSHARPSLPSKGKPSSSSKLNAPNNNRPKPRNQKVVVPRVPSAAPPKLAKNRSRNRRVVPSSSVPGPVDGSRVIKFKSRRGRVSHKGRIAIPNHYLNTLKNPADVVGVKIPDADFKDSATYHSQLVLRLDTNAQGMCAVAFGTSLVDSTDSSFMIGNYTWSGTVNPANTGTLGCYSDTTETADAPFASTTAVPIQPGYENELKAMLAGSRLVSACLQADSAASFSDNQGFVMVGTLPKNFLGGAISGNTLEEFGVNDLVNLPYVKSQAINLGGLETVYTPTDNTCFEYASALDTSTKDVGAMFAIIYGMPPSTPVEFKLFLNYEITLSAAVVQMGVTPSHCDQNELDQALNVMFRTPLSGAISGRGNAAVNCNYSGGATIAFGTSSNGSHDVYYAPHLSHLLSKGEATATLSSGPTAFSTPQPLKTKQDRTIFQRLGDFILPALKAAAPHLLQGVLSLLA